MDFVGCVTKPVKISSIIEHDIAQYFAYEMWKVADR